MAADDWVTRGDVFDAVASTYDARRPRFPPDVIEEIASITGVSETSNVLEIGPGTGQATEALARLGASVVAVERGAALAELAARRLRHFPDVDIILDRYEEWDADGRRFDVAIAANCWHWIHPVLRWRKTHDVLVPHGWLVLVSHIVVREPDEPEVYSVTADLHEHALSGHPGWGHPPTAEDVINRAEKVRSSMSELELAIGRAPDPSSTDDLFEPPVVRWYRTEQRLDAQGFAELLRTTSLYGSLEPEVKDPLLGAIEERIRSQLGDAVTRHYLICARLARRIG